MDAVLRQVRRVAVLGLGNVAVDCARMLLQAPARLAATDVAGHALAQLARSAVRSVDLIGRRGPVQVRSIVHIGCSAHAVTVLLWRFEACAFYSVGKEACVIAWAMEPACLLRHCACLRFGRLAKPLAVT